MLNIKIVVGSNDQVYQCRVTCEAFHWAQSIQKHILNLGLKRFYSIKKQNKKSKKMSKI